MPGPPLRVKQQERVGQKGRAGGPIRTAEHHNTACCNPAAIRLKAPQTGWTHWTAGPNILYWPGPVNTKCGIRTPLSQRRWEEFKVLDGPKLNISRKATYVEFGFQGL